MTSIEEDKVLMKMFREPKTKEKAYEKIVQKYQERLYWHIRKMVITHDLANDVLQDSFLNVWLGLENFREEAQIYTWMYRIATNECLKVLEKQKRRNQVSFEDKQDFLENTIRADENFDTQKLEWKLQLAIQQLPPKQRTVFNLRYFDEMPYEEMASILDTSVGALKASYFHAANKIEDYIKQTMND